MPGQQDGQSGTRCEVVQLPLVARLPAEESAQLLGSATDAMPAAQHLTLRLVAAPTVPYHDCPTRTQPDGGRSAD
jgi:hypothetical protein